MSHLTEGQRIALNTYFIDYPDEMSFQLMLIEINEDRESAKAYERIDYYKDWNSEIVASSVEQLANWIDLTIASINKKLKNPNSFEVLGQMCIECESLNLSELSMLNDYVYDLRMKKQRKAEAELRKIVNEMHSINS